jgi:hypothetical protein
MSLALHWTASRSVARNAACERDENYITRRFDAHECRDEDDCPLRRLENQVTRYMQFHIVDESAEVVRISMPVKK